MKKAQKIVIGFFVLTLIVIATLYIIYLTKLSHKDIALEVKDNTLFYSLTCPHCKNVEAFIDENNITKKINITQLEVSQNKTNANQLIAIGEKCKIDSSLIGAIPLFYSNGFCYVGDTDIILMLNKTMSNK